MNYKEFLSNVGYWECEPGWYPMINDLKEELIALDEEGFLPENFEISQLKQKYGELTIYTSGTTDILEQLLSRYTLVSRHICEMCSRYGKLRILNGWIMPLCNSCYYDFLNYNLVRRKNG
jgi:hypothetical protein